MVVPEISNPFYSTLVEAVVRAVQHGGREVLLADSLDDPETELLRIRGLLSRLVDGMIVIPCDQRHSARAVELAAASVPVVLLDRTVRGVRLDSVSCDDQVGIDAVVAHLEGRIDDSLHLLSSAPTSSTGRSRLDAFRKAVAGRTPPGNEHLGAFDAEWGREETLRLLASDRRVRTLVCGADVIALGALRAVQDSGLRVPEDVWVTGYDDISFAALANPPLTTVRQPVEELAAACIAHLEERLAVGSAPVRRQKLRPELVIRASTVPA
jgi:LacI family transcriptional regulator